MPDPISGDIVQVSDGYVPPNPEDVITLARSREWVVVHTVPADPPYGGPLAGLRAPDDESSEHPVAVPFEDLEVRGHLDSLEGWVEDSPRIWSQT